jgi:hypothetical protein
MPKKGKKGADKRKRARSSTAGIAHELRDAADPLIRLAGSPVVAELIASALIAGAGALSRTGAGEQALRSTEDGAQRLVEGAEEAGRKGADLANLVAYSVAIVAGEIATRIAANYERQAGGSEKAEQVAKLARKAADAAWAALGGERE